MGGYDGCPPLYQPPPSGQGSRLPEKYNQKGLQISPFGILQRISSDNRPLVVFAHPICGNSVCYPSRINITPRPYNATPVRTPSMWRRLDASPLCSKLTAEETETPRSTPIQSERSRGYSPRLNFAGQLNRPPNSNNFSITVTLDPAFL